MEFKIGDKVVATKTTQIPRGATGTVKGLKGETLIIIAFDDLAIQARWGGLEIYSNKFELPCGTETSRQPCEEVKLPSASCQHSDIRDVFISQNVGWIKVCHQCKQEQ